MGVLGLDRGTSDRGLPNAAGGNRTRSRERLFRWLATVFGWWVRIFVPLGPGLGFVESSLKELDVHDIVPSDYPPPSYESWEILSTSSAAMEDGLHKANVWAAVLNDMMRNHPELTPRGTVLTTVGFIAMSKVKLGVIHYLRPFQAFAAAVYHKKYIEIAGEYFPVVIRPWLANPAQLSPVIW